MQYKFPINPPYRITQKFGENKLDYSKFGLKAHNGLDIAVPRGTPILSPFNGQVLEIIDSHPTTVGTGYGNYFRLLNVDKGRYFEWTFGHILPNAFIKTGQKTYINDHLAGVDSTGHSTGDHLHLGTRELKPNGNQNFVNYLGVKYEILNYNNGYLGGIDPEPFFGQIEQEIYPVDTRYNQSESPIREYKWNLLHSAYAKEKAAENGLQWSDQLMKAFVYGYWPVEWVFHPAMVETWREMHYPEFKKRLGK